MVSDAQSEGTFSIPLLGQARTALSRLSVIRVVGCLPTAPGRAPLPFFQPLVGARYALYGGAITTGGTDPCGKILDVLKSLPVGKTSKSPIKPCNGRTKENSFSF
jgi:hypothetical protein